MFTCTRNITSLSQFFSECTNNCTIVCVELSSRYLKEFIFLAPKAQCWPTEELSALKRCRLDRQTCDFWLQLQLESSSAEHSSNARCVLFINGVKRGFGLELKSNGMKVEEFCRKWRFICALCVRQRRACHSLNALSSSEERPLLSTFSIRFRPSIRAAALAGVELRRGAARRRRVEAERL